MQFLERMQLEYNTAAYENKCYIVGACGFDSIPADMGTCLLEDKFGGQVNSIETFLNIRSKKVCTLLTFCQRDDSFLNAFRELTGTFPLGKAPSTGLPTQMN